MHSGMGHRCEWEDVFCLAFDVFWRQRRDCCSSLAQWMELLPSFLENVCRQWQLPFVSGRAQNEELVESPLLQTKRRRTNPYRLIDLPSEHGDLCPDIDWESEVGRFAFVVDCKPLAEVLNGHAPLALAARDSSSC